MDDAKTAGLYGIPIPEGYRSELRHFWSVSYLLDYATILVATAICVPLWKAKETKKMFFLYDSPDVNVPFHGSSIPETAVLPVVLATVPAFLVLLQFWFRNLHDLHHSLLGFFETLTVTTILHIFLWLLLGDPRPNFMHVCERIPGRVGGICANEDDGKVIDGRHNFPSGHAAFVVCAAVYFQFYILAKFSTFRCAGSFHTFVLPFLFVCFGIGVGASRVSDGQHSGWAVIAGIAIGIFGAFIGYHLQYPPFWKEYAGIPYLRRWTLRSAWVIQRNQLITPTLQDPLTANIANVRAQSALAEPLPAQPNSL